MNKRVLYSAALAALLSGTSAYAEAPTKEMVSNDFISLCEQLAASLEAKSFATECKATEAKDGVFKTETYDDVVTLLHLWNEWAETDLGNARRKNIANKMGKNQTQVAEYLADLYEKATALNFDLVVANFQKDHAEAIAWKRADGINPTMYGKIDEANDAYEALADLEGAQAKITEECGFNENNILLANNAAKEVLIELEAQLPKKVNDEYVNLDADVLQGLKTQFNEWRVVNSDFEEDYKLVVEILEGLVTAQDNLKDAYNTVKNIGVNANGLYNIFDDNGYINGGKTASYTTLKTNWAKLSSKEKAEIKAMAVYDKLDACLTAAEVITKVNDFINTNTIWYGYLTTGSTEYSQNCVDKLTALSTALSTADADVKPYLYAITNEAKISGIANGMQESLNDEANNAKRDKNATDLVGEELTKTAKHFLNKIKAAYGAENTGVLAIADNYAPTAYVPANAVEKNIDTQLKPALKLIDALIVYYNDSHKTKPTNAYGYAKAVLNLIDASKISNANVNVIAEGSSVSVAEEIVNEMFNYLDPSAYKNYLEASYFAAATDKAVNDDIRAWEAEYAEELSSTWTVKMTTKLLSNQASKLSEAENTYLAIPTSGWKYDKKSRTVLKTPEDVEAAGDDVDLIDCLDSWVKNNLNSKYQHQDDEETSPCYEHVIAKRYHAVMWMLGNETLSIPSGLTYYKKAVAGELNAESTTEIEALNILCAERTKDEIYFDYISTYYNKLVEAKDVVANDNMATREDLKVTNFKIKLSNGEYADLQQMKLKTTRDVNGKEIPVLDENGKKVYDPVSPKYNQNEIKSLSIALDILDYVREAVDANALAFINSSIDLATEQIETEEEDYEVSGLETSMIKNLPDNVVYLGESLNYANKVVFTSSEESNIAVDFVANEVVVKKNVKANDWRCLYLPFNVTNKQYVESISGKGMKVYGLAGAIQMDNTLTFGFTQKTTDGAADATCVYAHKPYLIKGANATELSFKKVNVLKDPSSEGSVTCSAGTNVFTFKSSTKNITVKNGDFYLYNNQIKKNSAASTTQNPSSLVVTATVNESMPYVIAIREVEGDELATFIQNVDAQQNADQSIYSISGQKLNSAAKHGLYIIGGKKVIK